MLVVAIGLLFSAIGAQAGSAKFSGLVTGLVMSAYFAGFVYGTYACPAIIRRVGHIRAFAAMASIASDSSDSASSASPSGGAQMNFSSCSAGSVPSGQLKPVSMTTEASNTQ
jgi:hypothetical protein